MVLVDVTPHKWRAQPQSGQALASVLAALDDRPIIRQLLAYRPVGRKGHPLRALFRAHLAMYALNLGSTNDLIRRLRTDARLRRLCGFGGVLPHRTTFNRFFARLANHADLVEACLAEVTEELRRVIPNLGRHVAVDSTAVVAYGNPHGKRRGDPDAAWGVKHSARARADGVEYFYGYKLHAAVCADHGVVLSFVVTPGNRSDSPELPVVVDKARRTFPSMRVGTVIADRGYDAASNFAHVTAWGAAPVILTRRIPGGHLRRGVYDHRGVPTCVGMVPMKHVRWEPERGHLFRCAGCHLAGKPGHNNCRDEVWEQPAYNPRLGGAVRMGSDEWEELYAKRQTIERMFKSFKQSLRLNRHGYRGLAKVRLHCALAALVYQATMLVNATAKARPSVRWMVAEVA